MVLCFAPNSLADSPPPPDTTPPVLTGISTSVPTVDVSEGPQTIVVTVEATDNASGINRGWVLFRNTGENRSWAWYFAGQFNLTDGSSTDGVWEVEVDVPQYLGPGTWSLGADLYDNLENSSTTYLSTSINVVNTGPADYQDPVIESVEISPQTIDPSVDGNVEVTVELSDNLSGIRYLWADMLLPNGDYLSDNVSYQTSFSPPITTKQSVVFNYPFSEFTPSGTYHLLLHKITDGVIHEIEADGITNPYPPGSTYTVTVNNPNEDLTPPELVSFQLSPDSVNVGDGTRFVTYEVEITDDISGLYYMLCEFETEAGEVLVSFFITPSDLTSGTITNGIYEGFVEIPGFTPAGNWQPVITLVDRGSNRVTYGDGGDEPMPAGSSHLEVLNTGSTDNTDPELVGFTVSPNPVNVSNGAVDVIFTLGFTDDFSGVVDGSITVSSPGNEFYEFVFFDDPITPTTGTSTNGTFDVPLQIPSNSPPGDWEVTVTLTDGAGNRAGFYSFNFPVELNNEFPVINTGSVDTTAPTLNSLNFLSSTPVDITNDSQFVDFAINVTDDYSGVDRIRLNFLSPTGQSDLEYAIITPDDLDPSLPAGTYLEDVLFSRFIEPGLWQIQVEISDILGNEIVLGPGGDAPLPGGIPATLEIVNSGPVDLTPIAVSNLQATATTVDITNGPASFVVKFDLADDVGGFNYGDIELDRSSPSDRLTYDIDPEVHLISGDLVNGSYSMVIEVPQYMAPGNWRITLDINDKAGRRTTIDDFQILTILNTGPIDQEAARVSGLSLPTSPLDVTNLSQPLPITLQITDDLGGFNQVRVILKSPSGDYYESENFYPEDLTAGTTTNGQFEFTLDIPQYAEPGTWTLDVRTYSPQQDSFFYGSNKMFPPGITPTITVLNSLPPSPYLTFLADNNSRLPPNQREPNANPDGDPYSNLMEAILGLNPGRVSLPGGNDTNTENFPTFSTDDGMLTIEFTPSEYTEPGGVGSPLTYTGMQSPTLDGNGSIVVPQALGDGRYKVEIPISGASGFLWLQGQDPNWPVEP